MKATLYAGCGRADITPEIGGHLYGYSDDEYSIGIHDRLDAKALALSDGVNPPILLISVSVCEIGTPFVPEIRIPVAEACGTSPERVILSCIHTHSAPNVAGLGNLWGSRDKPYFDGIFVPAIVSAAKQAVSSLEPAEFAAVKGETEIGVNRRERKLDGKVKLGQNPWGPQDKDMIMLRLRNSETKKGIFQMVYYGCHGTAAGHALLLSRDWMGMMLDALEADSGIMTGYWSGSIGDVGPRLSNGKTTGDLQQLEELGAFAAKEGLRIAKQFEAASYETALPILRRSDICFSVPPMPPREEVEAFLLAHPDSETYTKSVMLKVLYMRKCKARYDAGEEMPKQRVIDASVLTLGEIAFCFTPFELFSETTLMLRKFSPYRLTMGVSVTNGFDKYLPSQTEIIRGGYEVNNFRYALVPLPENADFILLNQFLDILAQMHGDTTE